MRRGAILLAVLAAAAIAGGIGYYRFSRQAVPNASGAPASTLTDAEKSRVRNFWAAFRNGEALQREGRWKEAVPEYRRALAFDPRHEGALYNLANCYIELDRFTEALAPLRKLVEVNPLSQRGHLQLGLVSSCPQAGAAFDLDAAEKALRRAFEINQEETGSLLRLAEVALAKGDEERAVELYALANRSNFRAVEGYYLRGYVRWKQGHLDAARELLREAARQSMKPMVVAGVPGEGATRPGSKLPPSRIDEKRLIKPFWVGLAKRFPEARIEERDLAVEFRKLEAWLAELKRRIASAAPQGH